jgi:PhnB protein
MHTTIHLSFDGNCEDAFGFYESAAGGRIEVLMRYGQMPGDPPPPELRNRAMHARIALGDLLIMGADAPPGRYQKPQGFSVSLNFASAAEAEKTFHALSQGGTVQMPLQETFFAHTFGTFTDRFGVPWMIVCEKTP